MQSKHGGSQIKNWKDGYQVIAFFERLQVTFKKFLKAIWLIQDPAQKTE